jgi:pantoate--beta-alanine ligase
MTVRVIRTAAETSAELESVRAGRISVGLVPTMGALHSGHRALLERASAECGFVAATIFVNPLQFNDPADLEAYPRTLEADLEVLDAAGTDLVFVPEPAELYPDDPSSPSVTVHVDELTEMLEGAQRPGHFDGVATVVSKLFAIAGRCRGYFGEKDFQQLAIVRRLARDMRFPVDVVGCETVREPDGLAISSRNTRLSGSERAGAAVIYRALLGAASAVEEGEDRPEALTKMMLEILATEPGVSAEYAVAVDPRSLTEPRVLDGEVRLLVAARVGPVRLIDNLGAVAGVASVTKAENAESRREK